MLDLDALEQTAEAATPGPWYMDANHAGQPIGVAPSKGRPDDLWMVCDAPTRSGCGESDLAFIAAANPQAVLALIRELRAARECVGVLRHKTPAMISRHEALKALAAYDAATKGEGA